MYCHSAVWLNWGSLNKNLKHGRMPVMTSYLSHLECTVCGAKYPANRLSGVSPCCGKVLYARYNLDRIRDEVDRDRLVERTPNMWRFAELLPVNDPGKHRLSR